MTRHTSRRIQEVGLADSQRNRQAVQHVLDNKTCRETNGVTREQISRGTWNPHLLDSRAYLPSCRTTKLPCRGRCNTFISRETRMAAPVVVQCMDTTHGLRAAPVAKLNWIATRHKRGSFSRFTGHRQPRSGIRPPVAPEVTNHAQLQPTAPILLRYRSIRQNPLRPHLRFRRNHAPRKIIPVGVLIGEPSRVSGRVTVGR